jgi:hypothetical protein
VARDVVESYMQQHGKWLKKDEVAIGKLIDQIISMKKQGMAEGGNPRQAAIAIAKRESGKYNKDGKRIKEDQGKTVHRIALTVTDPNHPMVSKRGETLQKTVRVPGEDPAKAVNAAIAHYRRKGYKVHDHHYIGTVEEDVTEGNEHSPVAGAITRRILSQRLDLLKQYGPELVGSAVDNVAEYVGDVDEIGSSDVSAWVNQVERMLKNNPPEAFAEDDWHGAGDSWHGAGNEPKDAWHSGGALGI